MRSRLRKAALLAAAASLTASAAGCGGAKAENGGNGPVRYATGATLTEAVSASPGSLDPDQSLLQTTLQVDSLAYDTLGRIDSKGGITGSVATRWDIRPASVTFTIRPGITCSDGTALTPQVIARNFAYIQDPRHKSPWLGVLIPAGSTTTAGPSSVTIRTQHPYAYLAEGAVQLPLICQAGLSDRSKLVSGAVGSGPFVLAQAVPGDHYTFTVRRGYAWGPGGARTSVPGFPARVVVKVVQNETTQANLLLAGQIQIAALGGSDRARLDTQPGLEKASAVGSLLSLNLNELPGHPASDPAVRKALLTAVNAASIAAVALDHRGARPLGLTVPPSPCLDAGVQSAVPRMNVAAAKAALSRAGWQPGAGGIRAKAGKPLALTLIYPPSIGGDSVGAAMELLAQEWKAAGASVTIKPETDTAYSQTLFGTGDWDAALLALGANSPAIAMPFYSGPAAPNGQNFAGVKNAQFTALASKALATPGAAGCASWVAAERALLGAGDVLPVAGLTTSIYAGHARFALNYSVGIEATSLRVTR